ncbi:MAG: 3-methyl-2-oxobutanoate dehydrogenase subunit beta [Clostridiales bacterium]|nr:3-methyl-2-oxobutanoate dehydrogenase subunit beta [Clostridiales bacterium]
MERKFMKGSEAIAEAAIRGGCRFFSGYPITPQNEIPEYFARRAPEVDGFSFRQGESEVASVNMVMGAAASGARAMTSSSSPGVALKSEGMSYIAGSALPMVLCSVMRGGPGIGSIQPSQQDYWQATKAMGNGGFKMLVFAPHTVQEAVDMTYTAFDYAERDHNPVCILADGCIASMMEPVSLPEFVSDEDIEKARDKRNYYITIGKGKHADGKHVEISSGAGRVKADVEFMKSYGDIGADYGVRGEVSNRSMAAMFKRWAEKDVAYEEYMMDDAEIVIAAYGTAARVSKAAIAVLRKEGIKAGLLRPILVNPFPTAAFKSLDPKKIKHILDVEMSIPGQMLEDVEHAVQGAIPISTCLRSCGVIISREEIVAAVRNLK